MPTAGFPLRHLRWLLPLVSLLAVAGCMGRWKLGDLGPFFHSEVKAPAPPTVPPPRAAGAVPLLSGSR